MEEVQGSSSAATGLEVREAAAPVDAGRLAGFLCQLHHARFDGVVHIASGAHTASIGFRAGTPVSFDDPTPGHTLADQFVERGQLTRAQCNTVLARMTDGLVEDETIAFCEHAVQLGFLPDEEATVELSSRIRARLIQLFSERDYQATLEHGEAALFERREFPQNLGAIVYMGVRTFYEEEFLASCHPDLSRTYVQLLAAPATIAHFFTLDDEEFQLLRRIDPESPASNLLEDRRVERNHLLAILLLLRLARFGDVSSVPLSRLGHSGARRLSALPQARRASAPPAAETVRPTAPENPPAPRPNPRPTVDATQEALLEAAARTARLRRASAPPRRGKAVHAQQAAQSATAPSVRPAPASPAASARAGGPHPPAQAQQGAQPRADYAKAHLKELIARRKQAAQASEFAPSGSRDAVRDLREARALLHAQQYARAEKLLAALVEQDPQNEALKAYHLWSRWRAQPELGDGLTDELHDLAKRLMSDTDSAGFAAYVLGHVYFHRKRDDVAERFFKRAYAADRSNKDAQRHLLILERRKQGVADAGNANRKIFGIQLPASKPKA